MWCRTAVPWSTTDARSDATGFRLMPEAIRGRLMKGGADEWLASHDVSGCKAPQEDHSRRLLYLPLLPAGP
jgi:hypothetical protein